VTLIETDAERREDDVLSQLRDALDAWRISSVIIGCRALVPHSPERRQTESCPPVRADLAE
jgi:hypothetical protein